MSFTGCREVMQLYSRFNTAIHQGFTLLELLVVIAIMTILSSFAYPLVMNSMQKQESLTLRNQLENFLKQGRQAAIIYQRPISLCVVNNSDQCVIQNGTTLLSFIDNNGDQKFDSQVDKLLTKSTLNPKFGSLKTSLSLNKAFIQLTANTGLPLGYMGNIKYCPTDGNNTYKFKVSFGKSGLVKTKTNAEEATGC